QESAKSTFDRRGGIVKIMLTEGTIHRFTYKDPHEKIASIEVVDPATSNTFNLIIINEGYGAMLKPGDIGLSAEFVNCRALIMHEGPNGSMWFEHIRPSISEIPDLDDHEEEYKKYILLGNRLREGTEFEKVIRRFTLEHD